MVSGVRTGVDQYGRNICELSLEGSRVDYDLLKNGLAWHYVKDSKDARRQQFEEEAVSGKMNLWSESGPIPPWDWRRWGDAKRKSWLQCEDDTVILSPQPDYSAPPMAVRKTAELQDVVLKSHWLNTRTQSRHKPSCRWFENTSQGRHCTPEEGHACGQCGG